jgi:PAS domain S-box-containing protein
MPSDISGFTFFKSYPEPAFVMDTAGIILDANAKFAERFAIPIEECCGRNVYDDIVNVLHMLEIAAGRKGKADEVLRTGKHISFEDEQEGKTLRSTIYPVCSQEGEITLLIVIIQDVTEEKKAERAVQKDLTVYKAILDAIPGAVVIVNANRQVKECNQHALGIIGNGQNELHEIDLLETIHPDDRDGLKSILFNILNFGFEDFTEARMCKHGTKIYKWYSLHGRKIMIDNEPHVLGIGINIDEQKKSSEALFESKIWLDQALDAARAGIWEADVENGMNVWSDGTWKLYGLEKGTAHASTELWASTIHPDDREMAIHAIESAVRNETEIYFEYRVCHPDFTIHWLMERGIPLCDLHSKAVRYVGTVIDITERKQVESALIDSKTRLCQALDAAHAGVWELDLIAFENFWSDEIWNLFGLERGDKPPTFQLWNSIIHPDDREMASLAITTAATKCENLNTEYRICHPDGSIHWLLSRGKPLYDRDGFVNRYIGTVIDITDQKQAETALIDNKIRFNLALEASHAGVWEWILGTDDIIWSDEIWALFGIKKSLSKPSFQMWINAIHPDDRDRVIRNVTESLRNGTELPIEYRICYPNGSIHWLFGRSKPFRDKNGIITRYIGAVIDITESKRIENELNENRNQLDLTLQKSRMGLWDLDLKTHIVLRTPEHDHIFGYETLLPHWTYEMFLDHIISDDREEVKKQFEAAVENYSGWNIECRIKRKDEKIRWIWATGGYHHDHEGNIVRVTGTIQDITDRKMAEQERELLQRELQQTQKMERVGQIAGSIAHDFNKLLTTMLVNTDFVLNQIDETDPHFEKIVEIRKAASRSAELTNQLLAFARTQLTKPKAVSLDIEIDDIFPMLRRLIRNNIEIIWHKRDDAAYVQIDPSQIVQIVFNLCVNARDAIADIGTITIETKTEKVGQADCADGHPCLKQGDYISLSVSDTGSGIDQFTLPHIFEPYFTTKDPGKAAGLGLSTIHGIVKQNDGYIDCRTEPGKGTTFSIYLPKYESPESASQI